ncbi:DUF4352 domain-containing protein [Pseudactinotalea sp. Z1732]|uniref:DUF4352 domain-containing protein n=1 Tax=Micrococcales TaxID=85006 RepID=UPI003C7DE94E
MSQHPQGPPPGTPTGPPHGAAAPHAPYPGPEQPEPPAPRKRNWFARHKILTGFLAVLAFVAVIGIATSGDGDEGTGAAPGQSAETNADAAQQDDEPAEAPGIGENVSDGDFEFVVTEVETGVDRIGSEFLNEQPQGQFVLVYLEVTNTGSAAETFWTSEQGLVDTEGRTHSADDSAALLLDDGEFLLTEINPGNTARTALVFDIPADAEPAAVELHGSMFSRGVTVNLQ